MSIDRLIQTPTKSFLLLGPRGTGKSTRLEQLVSPLGRHDWVVIDEIQRIPALLDEVHRLYEQHQGIHFALSGSSARKLRRANAGCSRSYR